MKKYSDYNEDCSNVNWTKFKIVVPTEDDRLEIMKAFKHFHDDAKVNSDFVTVNQLMHEYSPIHWNKDRPDSDTDPKNYNIIVDKSLYNKLLKKK